jgi:hypothetical protein
MIADRLLRCRPIQVARIRPNPASRQSPWKSRQNSTVSRYGRFLRHQPACRQARPTLAQLSLIITAEQHRSGCHESRVRRKRTWPPFELPAGAIRELRRRLTRSGASPERVIGGDEQQGCCTFASGRHRPGLSLGLVERYSTVLDRFHLAVPTRRALDGRFLIRAAQVAVDSGRLLVEGPSTVKYSENTAGSRTGRWEVICKSRTRVRC